jgi:hypothetical protein
LYREGVIKGSEKSLKFQNGHLDRETYLTLSHRTNPTFITRREAIWEIFLAYTKKNEELGHRDGADRYGLNTFSQIGADECIKDARRA